MKRMFLVWTLGSLCAVSTAFATTYMRVEKDGTKSYSDRPMPGGQPIEITPAQTYSAPPPPATGTQSSLPLEQQMLGQMDSFKYDGCDVTPKSEETFTNPERVVVGVTVMPGLRVGDIVDLRVDGTPVGGPTTSSHTIQPVYRGSHTVSVQVKDRFGRALCSSSSTFHVFRPSLNSPNRPTGGPVAPTPKPKPPQPQPKPTPTPKHKG
jgi:hypothetical protein